jgi:hypothetical protein
VLQIALPAAVTETDQSAYRSLAAQFPNFQARAHLGVSP